MDTDANFLPFYRSLDKTHADIHATDRLLLQKLLRHYIIRIRLGSLRLHMFPHKGINISHRAPYLWIKSEASSPARTKRPDNHNKTHILLCDCFSTTANQPSEAAYLFTQWKSIQQHLEALHFRTNVPVSRELRGRTQKSKYTICFLYFTELPPEIFPWSDKVKQTHAVNVSSLWLLPAVGSDADCICSLIQ